MSPHDLGVALTRVAEHGPEQMGAAAFCGQLRWGGRGRSRPASVRPVPNPRADTATQAPRRAGARGL